MNDTQNNDILTKYHQLFDKEIKEYDKVIHTNQTIIERSKDIIVRLNQAKETVEMEKNLIKKVIDSEETISSCLSKEKLHLIKVAYTEDEKNYEQMKLLNQQTLKLPLELEFIAATASTIASGSDVSGNIVYSIFGDIFLDTESKNKMKLDIETKLSEKIQFIESELKSLNPNIIGSFDNFIREWWSLSTIDQKVSRLIDLRTNVFDKIFLYNCNKKGYKKAIWFKKQVLTTKLHDNKRYYCIIFFILELTEGENLPQSLKNVIQDRAEKLQNNYNKICNLGKNRKKPESNDSLEKLMTDTIIFLYDCIKLRKTFQGR